MMIVEHKFNVIDCQNMYFLKWKTLFWVIGNKGLFKCFSIRIFSYSLLIM